MNLEMIQDKASLNKKYSDLNKNEEIMQIVSDTLISIKNEDFKKHEESIVAYNKIIESTAKLCRELNLNNPEAIFVVFNYLLWNG